TAHRQTLAQWRTRKDRLEAALARQIPELNLDQRLQAADGQAVAGALPPGSALAEFVRYEPFDFEAATTPGERRWLPARYLAFVVPAGEPAGVRLFDLGPVEAIDQRVERFRGHLTGEGEQRRDLVGPRASPVQRPEGDAGATLRATTFDPLTTT